MKAMVLESLATMDQNPEPLHSTTVPDPEPGSGEIRIRVLVCGACHTELDEIEGRTPPPSLPVILGHQVVGTVESRGAGAHRFDLGDRVGVAWIYDACGECAYCRSGSENLCADFRATGTGCGRRLRGAHGGPGGVRLPDSLGLLRRPGRSPSLRRRRRVSGPPA